MEWFERDFDHPAYFEIYREKEAEAAVEGPALAGLLALPRGSRVLDLPCGWGRLRPALEAAGHRGGGGGLSALDRAWGGLDGAPWTALAERWIYRARKASAGAGCGAAPPGAPGSSKAAGTGGSRSGPARR
jgi:hypothetical protein